MKTKTTGKKTNTLILLHLPDENKKTKASIRFDDLPGLLRAAGANAVFNGDALMEAAEHGDLVYGILDPRITGAHVLYWATHSEPLHKILEESAAPKKTASTQGFTVHLPKSGGSLSGDSFEPRTFTSLDSLTSELGLDDIRKPNKLARALLDGQKVYATIDPYDSDIENCRVLIWDTDEEALRRLVANRAADI